MGVVISQKRYASIERSRGKLMEMFEEVWERNKDLSPEAADELAIEVVRWARRESTRRKIASWGNNILDKLDSAGGHRNDCTRWVVAC